MAMGAEASRSSRDGGKNFILFVVVSALLWIVDDTYMVSYNEHTTPMNEEFCGESLPISCFFMLHHGVACFTAACLHNRGELKSDKKVTWRKCNIFTFYVVPSSLEATDAPLLHRRKTSSYVKIASFGFPYYYYCYMRYFKRILTPYLGRRTTDS